MTVGLWANDGRRGSQPSTEEGELSKDVRLLTPLHTRKNDRKQRKRNKLTTAKIQEGAHQWVHQGGKHKKWW